MREMSGEISADERIRAAYARTNAAGTARVLVGMSHGDYPDMETTHHAADGVAEFTTRRVMVTQSMIPPDLMSEQGINPDDFESPAHEQGEGGNASSAMADGVQAMMQAWTRAQPLLYDGGISYLQVDEGRHWTSFNTGSTADPRRARDPLWLLDALTGTHDAGTIGSDSVHDVAAAHYWARVDLIAADAAVDAGIRIPAEGPVSWWRCMPCQVWLDAQGRVLRMSFPDRPGAGDDTPLWTTTEIRDFGTPVDIAVPDADEIVEPRQVTNWPNQAPEQPQ